MVSNFLKMCLNINMASCILSETRISPAMYNLRIKLEHIYFF